MSRTKVSSICRQCEEMLPPGKGVYVCTVELTDMVDGYTVYKFTSYLPENKLRVRHKGNPSVQSLYHERCWEILTGERCECGSDLPCYCWNEE